MLIGSWAALAGQVTGSLPVNGRRPNSTSATPAPSEPGSQEATSASIDRSRLAPITCGRPETTSTTHLATAAQTRSTVAASPGCRSSDLASRGTPLSAGSNPQRGPPTSPKPSAYGVSPTTTTATSLPAVGALPSAL